MIVHLIRPHFELLQSITAYAGREDLYTVKVSDTRHCWCVFRGIVWCKILFLLVARTVQNLNEMVLPDIKRHFCWSDFSFKLEILAKIAREHIPEFVSINFKKYCCHEYKEGEKYIAMSAADERSRQE